MHIGFMAFQIERRERWGLTTHLKAGVSQRCKIKRFILVVERIMQRGWNVTTGLLNFPVKDLQPAW